MLNDSLESSLDANPNPVVPPPVRRTDSKWSLFIVAMFANFGGLVMGTAIGWTGPELNKIVNGGNITSLPDPINNTIFAVTASDGSWVASLYPIGALVGGLTGGTLVGKYGRKFGMYIITVLFAFGYLLLIAAYHKSMLFAGRLLCGYGTGLTTVAVPMYVSEISSADVRGMLGSYFQVMVTIGVLYVDVIGAFLNWRWISVACLGLVFVWSLLLLYIPESPVFYIAQRDFDGAKSSLLALRGHPHIDSELAELQESADRNAGQKVTIRDLAKPQHLKPLLISLLLMVGQQFSGINAIIFYSVQIFEAAHTTLNSFVETIIVAGTQVLATCFAAIVIDRLGRRVLLIASTLGMVASIYTLGTYFWLLNHDASQVTNVGFLPVLSLSVYILAFSIGFGPIPWLMMSEIFAPEVRTTATSISATFNWTLCFIVTQFFQSLLDAIGIASVFWCFGGILVVVFILSFIFVPETKGRSLDEIQEMFRSPQSQEDEVDILTNAVQDIEIEIQAESDIVRA